LNLLIIVKITAITVESATAIQRPTDIALQQNRFYPVVKPDGTWDFVHLYYREERILIIQM
jgi:flagellar basal body rod protein FlgG